MMMRRVSMIIYLERMWREVGTDRRGIAIGGVLSLIDDAYESGFRDGV